MSGLSAETLKKVIENETAVLRARIAKLEAALREARGWVQDDVNLDHRHRGQDVPRTASTPPSRRRLRHE